MPKDNTKTVGNFYESIALEHLQQAGLVLVERNYRWPRGEVDIIMRDGDYWVFVEVKYRVDQSYEHPLEQLRVKQLQSIRRSAQAYLYSNGISEYLTWCRFDVVAITSEPAELVWIKDAF